MRFFHTRQGAYDLYLNLFRQACAHSLQVHFGSIISHWLNKRLMPLFILEFDKLIFNGRTVARTRAFDYAAVKRRTIHIVENNFTGLG